MRRAEDAYARAQRDARLALSRAQRRDIHLARRQTDGRRGRRDGHRRLGHGHEARPNPLIQAEHHHDPGQKGEQRGNRDRARAAR